MTQFNLKKKRNQKKLYPHEENILLNTGEKLINDKLKFIKKDFFTCLFLGEVFEFQRKNITQKDVCDVNKIDIIDGKYSGIFSNFSTQILFASNLDDSLVSIYNKLEKNGLYCFNLLTINSMKTISKIFIEIDETIYDGAYNRFGPFHDVSLIIERLNYHKFKEIVVGTEFIEINYNSFDKLRKDFKGFGITSYHKNIPKFKKEFLTKSYSVFSKIIEKYEYIPIEFEIATFTTWK